MKRYFVNLTGPAAVLPAFLLGLFLPAGTRAQENGKVWLKIMAFTDAPVVGADVRITLGGPHGPVLADAKAATNRQGVFPAPVRSLSILREEAGGANGRSFVRISISGGTIDGNPFLGHLTADVVLTDPAHQILVVNPVTSLVSRVLDKRSELKLNKAEALVRRFLKLPANYSLGLALRQGPHYVSPFFSAVAFMAEARDAGGLDAFEHLLLQELLQELLASPSATHAFRPPQLLGSTAATSDAAQPLGSIAGTSPAISVIQAGLYAGILDFASSENLYNTAGWVLSLVGLVPTSNTIQTDIDAVTGALADLQSSIDNLSTQVAQLTAFVHATATETLYQIITTQAQPFANDVYDEENRLMYFAEDCPPLPAGSTPAPPAPGSFCAEERAGILLDLGTQPMYSAYTNVEGYVKDNNTNNAPLGTEGMLHLYSLWLGQSKQFFRPADSTKMQNLYDYWNGVLTQAADLKIERLHQIGEQKQGGNQLIAFMGNPDANPPTTGKFQADQAANLNLMFPPVPIDPPTRGATVINTQDHTMWALAPLTGFNPSMPAPHCATFGPNGPVNVSPYAGFRNWVYAPSKTQWQAAVSLAPTNTAWHDWLIQQTKTTDDEMPPSPGFFDWTRQCPGGGNPAGAVLTSTFDCSVPAYPCAALYMDATSNSFQRTSISGSASFDFTARTLAAGEQYFWYQ